MDGRNLPPPSPFRKRPLLMSRQEETAFQIDEVLRRGAELTEEFRQMATLRHHADTAAYRAKEERIEGKRLMLDEKMAALQRDVSLLDRRQTHLAAAQAHNDAKARVQDQREAQLTHHQQDIAARKKKALEQLAALEQRETKVVRWTEILSRREAAIVARETASLRSTKLHHQPPSVDSAVWGARKENPDPRLNPLVVLLRSCRLLAVVITALLLAKLPHVHHWRSKRSSISAWTIATMGASDPPWQTRHNTGDGCCHYILVFFFIRSLVRKASQWFIFFLLAFFLGWPQSSNDFALPSQT